MGFTDNVSHHGAADTVSKCPPTIGNWQRQIIARPHDVINMVVFRAAAIGEVGRIVASPVGAPLSVVIGGLGSLMSALIAAVKGKSLLNYESGHDT